MRITAAKAFLSIPIYRPLEGILRRSRGVTRFRSAEKPMHPDLTVCSGGAAGRDEGDESSLCPRSGRDRGRSVGGGSGQTRDREPLNGPAGIRNASRHAVRGERQTCFPAIPSRGDSTGGRCSRRRRPPVRIPPSLNQLPWSLAKGQFGVQGADRLFAPLKDACGVNDEARIGRDPFPKWSL